MNVTFTGLAEDAIESGLRSADRDIARNSVEMSQLRSPEVPSVVELEPKENIPEEASQTIELYSEKNIAVEPVEARKEILARRDKLYSEASPENRKTIARLEKSLSDDSDFIRENYEGDSDQQLQNLGNKIINRYTLIGMSALSVGALAASVILTVTNINARGDETKEILEKLEQQNQKIQNLQNQNSTQDTQVLEKLEQQNQKIQNLQNQNSTQDTQILEKIEQQNQTIQNLQNQNSTQDTQILEKLEQQNQKIQNLQNQNSNQDTQILEKLEQQNQKIQKLSEPPDDPPPPGGSKQDTGDINKPTKKNKPTNMPRPKPKNKREQTKLEDDISRDWQNIPQAEDGDINNMPNAFSFEGIDQLDGSTNRYFVIGNRLYNAVKGYLGTIGSSIAVVGEFLIENGEKIIKIVGGVAMSWLASDIFKKVGGSSGIILIGLGILALYFYSNKNNS